MDSKTQDLLKQWRASLSEREIALHDLAAVKLKKTFTHPEAENDNGSYFAEKSHAFKKWLAKKAATA